MSAAPVAARRMAEVLGWDAERKADEVARYLARVAAERASQEERSDEDADRVRLAPNHASPAVRRSPPSTGE